jgi:hypothetical protein
MGDVALGDALPLGQSLHRGDITEDQCPIPGKGLVERAGSGGGLVATDAKRRASYHQRDYSQSIILISDNNTILKY